MLADCYVFYISEIPISWVGSKWQTLQVSSWMPFLTYRSYSPLGCWEFQPPQLAEWNLASLLSWNDWMESTVHWTVSSIQKMQDRTRADTKPSQSWEALVAAFSGLHEALSFIGDQWIALARRTVREAVWVDMWPSLPQNSSFTLVGWWHMYVSDTWISFWCKNTLDPFLMQIPSSTVYFYSYALLFCFSCTMV